MQPGPERAVQRVFVAVWPPDDVRQKLAHVVQDVGAQYPAARAMASHNLHLTLAFIGSLATERVHDVARALASLPVTPFDWQLDRLGVFARAHVLWVGGSASAPLDGLARGTRELLDRMHIRYDTKPFAAHVTLLRDLAQAGVDRTLIRPIDWHITHASVVQSIAGASGPIYRPVDPN